MEQKEEYLKIHRLDTETIPLNTHLNKADSHVIKKDLTFSNDYTFSGFTKMNNNNTPNEITEDSEGDDHMNDILSKYIDKLDREHSDLKEDLRESRKEYKEDFKNSEDRITSLIESGIKQSQEQMRRLEDRVDKSIINLDNKMDKNIRNLDGKMNDNIRDLDGKMRENISELREGNENLKDKIDESNKYIKNFSVTAMVGIAGMVIAVIALVATVMLTI